MASSVFLLLCNTNICFKRANLHSLKVIVFIPTILALCTTCCILFYISSSSNYLLVYSSQIHVHLKGSATGVASISSPTPQNQGHTNISTLCSFSNTNGPKNLSMVGFQKPTEFQNVSHFAMGDAQENTRPENFEMIPSG